MMECHYTESRIVRLQQSSTRNSAVAECLSVVSFNSTIPRAQSLISLLITPASDLSTRAIKLCSVVFGVTSSYSVINKIHWCVARRRLFIAGYGRRISAITYPPPSKCWRHATVQPWSMPKSDISRKSPVFAPCRTIAITFGMKKTRMLCLYPTVKNVWRYVYSFRQNTRTWRTDGRTSTTRPHKPRLVATIF